jgi:hypothetical protein
VRIVFRRGMTIVGWGVAGIVLAAALIAGAFAVAGTRLTEPATPIHVSAPPLVAETSSGQGDRPAATRSPESTATGSPDDRSSGSAPTAAPTSVDDHGGNSGPGGGEPTDD